MFTSAITLSHNQEQLAIISNLKANYNEVSTCVQLRCKKQQHFEC